MSDKVKRGPLNLVGVEGGVQEGRQILALLQAVKIALGKKKVFNNFAGYEE